MGTTIERVEMFAPGTHNGIEFDVPDLDEMVRSFNENGLSGRLPVKLGHSAPDTDPARGWITKVWREGDRLLATLSDVPDEIVEGIRSGAWRHVSVELLRDVKNAAGRTYRWMLDGLALLGSARPAVEVLKPLHESMTREVTFAERFAFVSALPSGDILRIENAQLRAQLHRQQIDALIEGDVRARVVMASAREQFCRLFKLTDDASYARVAPGDWAAFRASAPRPPAQRPASFATEWSGAKPDTVLVERTRAYMAENALQHFQLTGERLTFDRAAALVAQEVARTNPELLRAYVDQPGEAD